jgi:hypothetical protein
VHLPTKEKNEPDSTTTQCLTSKRKLRFFGFGFSASTTYLAVKLIFVDSFIAIKPDGVQVCYFDFGAGLRIIY